MHDVVVIGGGVIGLTTAFELSQRGLRVVVIDKGDLGREASWAGAGILPPGRPGDPGHPLSPLCIATCGLWPALSAELRELTGIDNGFRPTGGVEFSPDADARSVQTEIELWQQADVEVEPLTASDLAVLEPGLNPLTGPAYRLPGVSQVRNPRHLKALQAVCVRQGIELRPHQAALSLVRKGERVEAVETETGRVSAAAVLVTAGAWSSRLLGSVGVNIEIEPVRGQIVLLRCLRLPVRHIVECGPRYVVPRADGRILIGSTEERVGFDKRNTAVGLSGILDFAERLVPALADATFETAWAGLRPRACDGLPYLGQIPGTSNLYVASGHFRDGLNLSPITARLMGQLICGETPEIALAALEPRRRCATI